MRLFLRASIKAGLTLLLSQTHQGTAQHDGGMERNESDVLFHRSPMQRLSSEDPSLSCDGDLLYPLAIRGGFSLEMVLRMVTPRREQPFSVPFECIYVDSVPICRSADGRPTYEQSLFRTTLRLSSTWSTVRLMYQEGAMISPDPLSDQAGENHHLLTEHCSIDLAEITLRRELTVRAICCDRSLRPTGRKSSRRLLKVSALT